MQQPLLDLVIMRHGEAESANRLDEARMLTDHGAKQIALQADKLRNMGFNPIDIVHSPYRRTEDSARICQQRFPDANRRTDAALLPLASPDRLPFMWDDTPSILVVSHMPLVGRLINYLCPECSINGLAVGTFVWLKVNVSDLKSTLFYDGCDSSL